MSKHRHPLPQLNGGTFLTDGGLETTLIFKHELELPCFAAFILLDQEGGRERLRAYYRDYIASATRHNTGFILESATWRASRDWGRELGYDEKALDRINREAIELLVEIRNEHEQNREPMVISGCIGPRDDGYHPKQRMSADEAQRYHRAQIGSFASTEADMVSAFTMTYSDEAIGITRAAQAAGIPVVISFTVETDGRLPSGETMQEAIERIDDVTGNAPAYYMINCAHPSHFSGSLSGDRQWLDRIHGVRANASKMSHEELDNAPTLDRGDPLELGENYRWLMGRLANLNVLGGCCGTDHHHIDAIGEQCAGGCGP